jgi:hypothetical protein
VTAIEAVRRDRAVYDPAVIAPAPKTALVVNGYFGERRRPARETGTALRTVAPQFLAGRLAPDRWRIRLRDEQTQGPLADADEVGDVDLLIVTGLTSALDRMRHLAAFAKTRNPRAVVVAGGPAVRAAPRLAAADFDYALDGDVESVDAAVADAFGRDAVAREPRPRFDLAPWTRAAAYAETSRSCNFRCGFCSITAEDRPFLRYAPGSLRAQLDAQRRRDTLILVDNNFYGPDRAAFDATLAELAALRAEGRFHRFGALVTADFFRDPARVARAHAAGCRALFCGVESFDAETLKEWRKRQNVATTPDDAIGACLAVGILPIYGLLLDVVGKTAAALRVELSAVVARKDGVLPAFVVAPIPFPGTPFFADCVARRRLLPRVRLRDLNGSTLCVRGIDDVATTAALVRDASALLDGRAAALRATWRSLRAPRLDALQRAALLARNLGLLYGGSRRGPERTHLATTEPEDALYRPTGYVAPAYRGHFRPTYLTDDDGAPLPDFADGAALAADEAAAASRGDPP